MTTARTIPFARPSISEEEKDAVKAVLEGHTLAHGPQGKEFESEFSQFAGGGFSCTVSSGMAALHLAYLELHIGPGDEVLVPALTHVATAHAVEAVGAKPVFVDCELQTGNLDLEQLESLITSKTKAIGLVHFLGIPCDMGKLGAIAKKHNLKIIEDCALALGSRFKGTHVGLLGDVGCFSFYPVKHITTGEGGMFLTKHKDLSDRVHHARGFGVDRNYASRSLPGLYDVVRFGLNYRMSDINAALGRVQLSKLQENLKKRQNNFEKLAAWIREETSFQVLRPASGDYESSFYCLSVVLDEKLRRDRNNFVKRLNKNGIGTSIYYPHPVPRLSYYQKKVGFKEEQFKNATIISDGSIAIPVGPHLTDEDIDLIMNGFKKALKGLN